MASRRGSAELPPIFTIGHSTHELETFEQLLLVHGVDRVVDVRSLPGSRKFPQFDGEALAESLPAVGIGYRHLAKLGGLRGRSLPKGAESPNRFWINASFRRYADYAMGEAFHEGLEALLRISVKQRCAIMCAEALWWRCHRRIITDYLIAAGRTVCHILASGKAEPGRMTAEARRKRGRLVYPG